MNALTLKGDGYAIVVAPEAEAQKKSILEQSKKITAVGTELEVDLARLVLNRLAIFRLELEKSRKTVKEPVLAVGKAIDSQALRFGVETANEEGRLTALVSEYARQQEAIRREAERKAAEAARLAEETRKAEERARIEAERAQEEARMSAFDDAKAPENASRAVQEAADRAAQSFMVVEAERKTKEEEAEKAKMQIAAPVKGTKAEWDFEVENIHTLYKHNPMLVELSPKRREILEFLKRFTPGSSPEIPGLKVIEKFTVNKR